MPVRAVGATINQTLKCTSDNRITPPMHLTLEATDLLVQPGHRPHRLTAVINNTPPRRAHVRGQIMTRHHSSAPPLLRNTPVPVSRPLKA